MTFQQFKWVGLGLAAATFTITSVAVSARQDEKPGPGPDHHAAFKVSNLLTDQSKKARDPREKRGPTQKPSRDKKKDGPGQDPLSRQILQALEEPIAMSFPNETPLEDVLRYIKQATTNPHYAGISIYVDPIGLQEAERSMNSTITIDLEGGIPLRRTLQLMLKQLGLAYFVDDGILVITTEDRAVFGLPPLTTENTPLANLFEEARRGTLPAKELEDALKYLKMRDELLEHGFTPLQRKGRGAMGGAMGFAEGDGPRRADPGQDDPLRKDLRELIGLLKAERAAKSAAEKEKPASQEKSEEKAKAGAR